MTGDELPILKGILNGVVNYHNAPVRFGRVPKREKARILAAMQQSSNSRTLEKAVSAELEDEQRLLATVVRAHLDTCDFTRDKVEPMLTRARDQPSYTACPPTLACPLNPNPQPLQGQQELLQDFSKRFSPAIRGVVEFAKRIPGFSLLAQDDQVTLLKAGVFEVLLVRLACMFDAQTSTMICLNGQVLKRDSIHNSSNARFLMDSMFDFAERVNSLRLSDAEIGLFCSVVVIAADRPGLRNTDLIEKMHNKLKTALQIVMAQNRPGHPDICHELMKKVPDLRTLNTLHSEKLLAFKMTEQQQQLQQQMQQQQQQHWSTQVAVEDEGISKSPAGSSWSSSSDVTMDEAKSPLGSVSSTESMCSGEIASLTEYHHLHQQQQQNNNHHHNTNNNPQHPSLHPNNNHRHHHHHQQQQQQQQQQQNIHHQQQQQAAQQQQHHHHQQQQLAVSQHASSAPLLAATLAGGLCPHRHRANSGSTSSGDDELANTAHLVHNGLTITPVVRPATAAHHRFRKLDSPSDSGIESGTEKLDKLATSSAPTSLCSSPRSSLEDQSEDKHNHIVEDMPVLKRVLQAPPLYDTNSLMDEAYKPHKKFRALRNKDSAEAEPSCSSHHQQLHIHHHHHHQQQQQQQQHNHQQQQNHLATAASAGGGGSLSSTHSTLAKSLMEGPRMTAEQMKRTDIIHNYIMRGGENGNSGQAVLQTDYNTGMAAACPYTKSSTATATTTSGSGNTLLVCATTAQPVATNTYHHHHHQQQWSGPASYGTSVITTTTGRHQSPTPTYVLVPNSTSQTPPPHATTTTRQQQVTSPADFPRIYFHPQSPQSSTCISPPQHRKSPPTSPTSTAVSSVKVELQVDIAADAPLNLSKKSPSPSPRLAGTAMVNHKSEPMEL